ncbi:MAG TPA: hypothetical protein VK457_22070 [Chloroflexota bacterium]|jgi:hypothetical protein|nr:hypothetical protein [Chloroflexota bacterium]
MLSSLGSWIDTVECREATSKLAHRGLVALSKFAGAQPKLAFNFVESPMKGGNPHNDVAHVVRPTSFLEDLQLRFEQTCLRQQV